MSAARQLKQKALQGCDEISERLERLRVHHGKLTEEIHAIRKLGKKVRGCLLALDAPKAARQALTAMARLFAARRDAVSRHTTWRRLKLPEAASGTPEAAMIAIPAMLAEEMTAADRRLPAETIALALQQVAQARALVAAMPDDGLHQAMQRGHARLQRRLLKRAAKQVAKPQSANRLHDLRKAVKAALGGGGKQPALEDLAEVLGDDNDLTVLEGWLEGHGFHPWNAGPVFQRIGEKHRKLRDEIHRHARRWLER